VRWELQPLEMVVYAYAGGNNKERCETRGYGRLLSYVKVY